MEQYSILAKYYDAMMSEIDYDKIVSFYESCFEKFGTEVKSICDVACGTGVLTTLMAQKGYAMSGIDLSCDMLSLAQQRADEAHVKITFSEQDMTSFNPGMMVDAMVCSLDGVNYLTSTEKVKGCFESVARSLNENGLFIFDVGTPYKFEHILGDNAFVYELDDVFLSWQSFYNEKQKMCDYLLTFFAEHNGVWHRYDEEQRQKAYTARTLENALASKGFEVLGVYSDTDFSIPEEKSDRWYYVCRKVN